MILLPGDVVMVLREQPTDINSFGRWPKRRGGVLLCVGSDELGADLMLTDGDKIRFVRQSWDAIKTGWKIGQTRKLSTWT